MNFMVISVEIKSIFPHFDVPLFIRFYKSDHKMAGLYLAETKKKVDRSSRTLLHNKFR